MRVPGMSSAGAKTAGIVECVDLYPTLVDLCGLPAPAHELDGLSFSPLLHDPRLAWKKAAFSQWMDSSFSVKTDRYDYIEDAETGNELFDFVLDPDEERNLIELAPEVASAMKDLLAAGWRRALPEGFEPG
jgi:arylsulfatase A-like enzyme